MKAILKNCLTCKKYTMKDVCACGGKAIVNQPAKFSPEDHYGEYRRKLKMMDR